jgi:uncharacterized protein
MGGLAQRDVVAVLTRAPSAGGKSRLFAELGTPPDATLLAALLLDTIDAVTIPDVTRLVAVEPGSRCDEVRALVPDDLVVIPQPEGTLGERMAGIMRLVLERGARAVALIGSDLPLVPASSIAHAFACLHDDPRSVVLGPAIDGGYYLIAACDLPDLFHEIEWGTGRVLEQTRLRAANAGIRLHLVEPAFDVDTVADLRLLQRLGDESVPETMARRSREWALRRGITAGKRPIG